MDVQRLATRSAAHASRAAARWSAVLLVAVCAAVAASTVAAAPAGFYEAVRLDPAASFVAGKPASIYCAATMAAYYEAGVAATGRPSQGTAGFSTIGGSQSFLSTWVCSYLNRWLAHKPVTRYHLAVSIEVLAHEAELERGIADESLADCAALAAMPQVVRRFFPLRGIYTLHGLMADAWAAHALESPVYLTNCPAR